VMDVLERNWTTRTKSKDCYFSYPLFTHLHQI
jgi:hypothetical protein